MRAKDVGKTCAKAPGTLRRNVLRGGAVIAIGSLGWQVLRLLGAIVLARLLGPEQFGLASVLLLVVSFVEMSSDASLDKQIVQARDGDSDAFLGTSHAFAAIRGIVACAVLVGIAVPASWLVGVPGDAWAFATLGAVPLLTGFSHLDRKRVQREFRFIPDMSVEFISQIGVVIVGSAVAWWTRHFTASMWGILTGSIIALVASFSVAERSYRWSWDADIARRLMHFGWPLVLSNILLFGLMQGERLLLASAPRIFPAGPYSVRDLGLFAAAGTLAYAPVVVVARLGSSISLPLLSSARENAELFERRFYQVSIFTALSALLIVCVFALAGPVMLDIVYGSEYADAQYMLLFLAISQAFRIVRVAPTVGALALDDSRNTLWANLTRLLGLGFSVWVLACGFSVAWLAASAAIAEFLALIVSVWCYWKLQWPSAYQTEG